MVIFETVEDIQTMPLRVQDDSAITVGVFSLVLFHRNFFNGQIQATNAAKGAESSSSAEVAQDALTDTSTKDEEAKG